MLGLWPIVAIWLYRTRSVTEATIWTILGGHMFLAVKTVVDLPLLPPLGKESVPALAALIGCRFVAKKRISVLGQPSLVRWLLLLFIVTPFVTTVLNRDAIFISGLILPPMGHYDALSVIVRQSICIIPFFLGRQLFRGYQDQLLMFRGLVIAGLFYSLLMLFEVRMSPQLHTWIYGYFPHSFIQQIRFGGFRPVVFMGHGLLVSFFAAVTVIAASAFWQIKIKVRQFSPSAVTFYLLLVLALCKSIASIVYGFAGFLLIKMTSPKTQLRVARILVLIALLYPVMNTMNNFQHQKMLMADWVASINPDRGQSLAFRFNNEHELLEHASKRFFFGWGTWGRNRIYDKDLSKDISVTDGRWIVTLGQFGWFGFIAEFGLMALPVFRAMSAFKFTMLEGERSILAAHALLVGVIMINQLLNSSLAPWLWLLMGGLMGRAEAIIEIKKKHV